MKKIMRITIGAEFAAIGLTVFAKATAAPPAETPIRKSTSVIDDQKLRAAPADGANWITHGGDLAETRFSPLDRVNPGNVGKLQLLWSIDTGHAPRPGGDADRRRRRDVRDHVTERPPPLERELSLLFGQAHPPTEPENLSAGRHSEGERLLAFRSAFEKLPHLSPVP